MTSFSFFKYFDAFELDVNIVNFVYYGKTRLCSLVSSLYQALLQLIVLWFVSSIKLWTDRAAASAAASKL